MSVQYDSGRGLRIGAPCTQKTRWQECNESHDNKFTKARIDTKPKGPITKDQLVKNLIRKMNAFTKILHGLPMMASINTDDQKQAYIDDTEGLTRNLETFIHWTWDGQAIAGMRF